MFTYQAESVGRGPVVLAKRVALMAAVAALFAALGAQGLLGQTGRATITGVVTDAQGAVIPDATVTAINQGTSVATKTATNQSGEYTLAFLTVGAYTIQVEKEGFATQAKTDFVLTAEQNVGLNFTLQVGQVSQKVEVRATNQTIETESAALGQVVNEDTVLELPLNGRDPADLVFLTPGTVNVLNTDTGQHQSYTTFPVESGAGSSGGRQGSTLYLLDGAYNEDNYHLLASPFPNPDATQEFKVIGNNFDARYGFAAGGVVSIVTKSGTNDWHGDAFEFLRNYDLNSADFFTHQTDSIKRNQFGGSIGGPIKKDKLFIFGNYQGTRQLSTNLPANGYVPTAAMRNGDFSAYCQSGFNAEGFCQDTNPNPNNPSDPYVNDQLWVANAHGANGEAYTVSQVMADPSLYYAHNYINPSTFNASSVKLANLFPTTGILDQYGHYIGSGYDTDDDYNEETIHADYNISDHQRITGRAFINFFDQPTYSASLFNSNRSWIAHWQSYSGTYTWTLSPRIVNNLTGSYSRLFDNSGSGLAKLYSGKGICYSQFIQTSDPANGDCSIESIGIGGGYDRGGVPINAQNFNAINRYTWGISDSLNISKGRHLIVAGVDILRQWWYENTDWLALPLVSFSGGPEGQFTGSSFADFLLGDLGSWEQGGGESNEVRQWMIAPYAADQIKVKPNLTVSVGLRYEPWVAPVVAGGRISTYIPGEQSTRYPNAPLGMVFPGDKGVPGAGLPSDYHRFFDPRVGVAWQPSALPNTSVRAAIGMFATAMDYANFNHASDLAPFSPTYSFYTGQIVNGSSIPIIPFTNPWSVFAPTGNANPFPPFSSPGTVPGPSATIATPVTVPDGFAPNFTDGHTYTWNVSIEHQFASDWLIRGAYVGSESDHQSIASNINWGQFFGAGNPANGTPLNPNFGTVLLVSSPGTASYQAAQFTLDKKLTHGLLFTANYTFAHTIDWFSTATTAFTGSIYNPRCLRCNRGNSTLDVPQTFTLDFIYTTPRLAGWNRAARAALGGWELSGIWSALSGSSTQIYSGENTSWDDGGGDFPDYASGYHGVVTHPGQAVAGTNLFYLDKANFVIPAQGSKGDVGRGPSGLYYPGVVNLDLGLDKNFKFQERYRLQVRWEMFNSLNHPIMGCLDETLTDNTFGQFYCAFNTPRVMQLALKLYF